MIAYISITGWSRRRLHGARRGSPAPDTFLHRRLTRRCLCDGEDPRGRKDIMKHHATARPAEARPAPHPIRRSPTPSTTSAWKPEPSAISRAEMRDIIIEMIG
ncbi:hypothetical protein GCM10008174_01060 [Methylopila turkensis]|uniref:Uncharacterized protein n=1 Tax=Methylopila turkensis TaxID=1437816 RepID=A0A9W6JM54_9HYPH|nr:hypothetical protein GCM10008174_01060 [Methylopila turkensis]